MKRRALPIFLIITLCSGLIFVALRMIKDSNEDRNKQKLQRARIGNSIIIRKDTLTIVDCSWSNQTYTLSNGLKVDVTFVEKLEKK